MILFILKAHRALHFSRGVDKRSQQIAGQRMVVAAGVYVLEPACVVIMAFGVSSLKEKTLNFVGRVKCVVFILIERSRVALQQPTNVRRVR